MAKIKVLEVIRLGQIGGGESHLLDFEMIRRLTQMGIAYHVINTQKPFDMKVQGQIIKLIQDDHIQLVYAHGSRASLNILSAKL